MLKKIGLSILGVILLGVVVISITVLSLRQGDPPPAEAGPEAEALTDRIESAIGMDAWRRMGAVSFVFDYNGNRHFRDHQRRLVEVKMGEGSSGFTVHYHEPTHTFIAWQGRDRLEGEGAQAAFQRAYEAHTNDFFWLNPFAALRAPGTKRELAGERALLLTFESGGVTPGDRYLIVVDENGLPESWRLWVSIPMIPNGLEYKFENWTELSNGAKVSLSHPSAIVTLELSDVEAYPVYPQPGETDRFSDLVAELPDGE